MIDRTILKLREEDPRIPLQEALDKACYWKNLNINATGYSAHQLTFGIGNPTVPGIVDGHLASDELATKSDAVKKIISNHISTREAFREANNEERIKKMLKQRIPAYNDVKYHGGEEVYVKDRESEGWEGPWKVKCHQNKIVTILKQNNEY